VKKQRAALPTHWQLWRSIFYHQRSVDQQAAGFITSAALL